MLHSLSIRPPTDPARRRVRIVVGLLCLTVIGALVLQYTPYHLLPARKTDTLWGILTGVAAMAAFAEYRWSASIHRDRPADER